MFKRATKEENEGAGVEAQAQGGEKWGMRLKGVMWGCKMERGV